MKAADLLFMPVGGGKRERLHLPGKLYEYAAAGKPILALTHPDGESASFLSQVGGGVVLPPNDQHALRRLLQQLSSQKSLPVPPQDRTKLESFQRNSLAERLASVLTRVCQQSSE